MTSRLGDDLRIVFEDSYDPPRTDMVGTIRSALHAEAAGTSDRLLGHPAKRRVGAPAVGQSVSQPDRRRPAILLQTIAAAVAVGVAVAGMVGGSLLLLHRPATAPAVHTTLPVPAHQPFFVTGNVLMPVSYPGTGASLDPPGSLHPTLSAVAVLKFCSPVQSTVACETGPPRAVQLGLLTDAGMGIQAELVWAITWTGVGCDPMGPLGRPSPGPNVNDATGCDFVTFVDARTGKNPEAIRGPFGL